MAKDYSKSFYNSQAWQELRVSFLKEKHYICERCKAEGIITPATEVHHKTYITPNNINDPSVTLNKDNLECLCHTCHTREHQKKDKQHRYTINSDGSVDVL